MAKSGSLHYNELFGIIGGIGPEASAKLYHMVIRGQHCLDDAGHIPLLIFNNPQVPQCNKAMLGQGPSPVPELTHTAQILEKAGATKLVMACNTAHAFLGEVQKGVSIPILDMLAETAQEVVRVVGRDGVVGLMASDGTLKGELYHKALAAASPDLKVIVPTPEVQAILMDGTHGTKGIKAGFIGKEVFDKVHGCAVHLVERGAQIVVTGCTEQPVVLNTESCPDFPVPLLDPMAVMAKTIIQATEDSKAVK